MTEAETSSLARHFFDSIEAGDIDAVIGCYADNAAIWHNTDNIEQTPEDNRRTLGGFIRFMPYRAYENRRLTVFPGGFVHQHDLVVRNAKGGEAIMRACLICAVADGKITRLDEYMDSADNDAIVKLASA